jgi:hypothetical protein
VNFLWWRTHDTPRPESDRRVEAAERRTESIVERAERAVAALAFDQDHLAKNFMEGRRRDS